MRKSEFVLACIAIILAVVVATGCAHLSFDGCETDDECVQQCLEKGGGEECHDFMPQTDEASCPPPADIDELCS